MISCRSNGITPTCHPPCHPPHCANTPDKMTFDWYNTQTVLLFWRASRPRRGSGKDGSHWTRCSLPKQPLLQQHNSGGSVQYLFSSVYWRFCRKNNNNMVAARLAPNRCCANICTGPAVRAKKDDGMDFQHTPTHTHTHKDRHKHPRQLFVLMQSPISVYFQN